MSRCISCFEVFPHPGPEDDCPSTENGLCQHLVDAGAVDVTVRVTRGHPSRARTLFIAGGWLCATCAARYGAK